MLPHRSLRRPAEVGTARSGAAPRPKASGLSRRSVAALLLALALNAQPDAAQAQRTPDPPTSIDIVAQPLPGFDHTDSTRRQFGLLEFRGGLVLTASFKQFGGRSAIRVQPDGANFIALTDKGWWLKGRIVYDGNSPSAIADAQMAPILGPDGLALSSRGWYDTESLAQDGGTLYVGIERVNRIVRFDFGRLGMLARAEPIPVPPGVAKLPHNKGLEALE